MRIAVIQFPGSNCERETALAIKRAGMEPVEFLWNEAHEKLRDMDGFVIVGGFSYEDRSRAGIIAALDPVMQEIKLQSEIGKPVLGICNGAQILVETGLVPGLEGNKLGMALTENKRIANGKILGTGYYNDWIYMRVSDDFQRNAFTSHLTPKDVLHVPIAHGEGRFVMQEALLREIQIQGLNVFQYCDVEGNVIDRFPINPNGSINNIAAVSNKAGNVMAMMPHPERFENGDAIFKSMHDYISKGHYVKVEPLNYYPRRKELKPYIPGNGTSSCMVELIITDNHALTVQNTLHHLGMPVTVKRYDYWELDCDRDVLNKIAATGVLYNERKEQVCHAGEPATRHASAGWHPNDEMPACAGMTSGAAILVCPKEDLIGQQKRQALQDHFDITDINQLRHGTVWSFDSAEGIDENLLNQIVQTNIIANPYVHDCYHYNRK